MKKYVALILCAALLLCVSACGDDTPSKDTATTSTTTTTTTVGESTTTGGDATTTVADGTTTGTPSTDGGTVTTTAPVGGDTTAPTTTPSTGNQSASSATDGVTTTTTTTTTIVTTTTTAVPQPNVVLPAIGTDIDVKNKKDRIRVSEAVAVYNPDGTIAVTLTFKNYNKTYITEETDWVEYTCYDKSGNVVQKATRLALGCIDTKKHPSKTFEFNVPANTAEVRLTNSKIVYWTEWS